ncbi:DUF1772 domain-containing protein [Acuticoccus sp. MNP-M23]|uniref:anthrone oxygenase family protein n=1 Tax=Acuticoccus sp. MNP-M23 TaxID=3072793 RepID=UPI00281668B3|nr:anthrone oxygenase family protein [Acuticoccus sp. MNP-M23]WMS44647.1 DUF1772 domain-containing protein [Acuticoccus sp. MNP-M23]
MRLASLVMIFVSLLSSAAIFGFFYAWVCSTMWGLDAADPRVAIAAMQAMNASVRNAVFAPVFFGTPVYLAVTAALLWARRARQSAGLFALSAAVSLVLGAGLTMAVNVPMNEALALVVIPDDPDAARAIWQDFSAPWQVWNQIRTAGSGAAFLIAVLAVLKLPRAAGA